MLTLHLYFARELLKTFLMTSVALTLLIVMGGGVANIFRGEGIGAEEMARVFMFLTPVAVTLILPVAALFSAAITYGRSAADNEVLACRAAGINIHKILLSALVLGALVTAFTYWSWNYLIPQLSRQIEELSRRDLPSIVMNQFKKAKPLAFSRFRITAARCDLPSTGPEGIALPPNRTYLELQGVAFLEVEQQEVVRFGTSKVTLIEFDRSQSTPRVTVDLYDVRSFDAARKQYYELEHQSLGPFDIPIPIRRKTKFENLGRLIALQQQPELDPEIADIASHMRREMMSLFLNDEVQADLDPSRGGDGTVSFQAVGAAYVISAEAFAVDPDDGRTLLRGVRVEETGEGGPQTLTAHRANIELRSGLSRDRPVIMVDLLENVQIRRRTGNASDRAVRKDRESLRPIPFFDQPVLAQRVAAFDFSKLADPSQTFELYVKQERLRERLLKWIAKLRSEIEGEVHFRASYSLSTIAVVLFGAVLGIIIRGGQVLTAFGISCIPMVFVVVASIVGRNLADQPEYITLSVMVMWSATGFMYLVTGFFAVSVLKR